MNDMKKESKGSVNANGSLTIKAKAALLYLLNTIKREINEYFTDEYFEMRKGANTGQIWVLAIFMMVQPVIFVGMSINYFLFLRILRKLL